MTKEIIRQCVVGVAPDQPAHLCSLVGKYTAHNVLMLHTFHDGLLNYIIEPLMTKEIFRLVWAA